jgi:hypothetical protein
MLMLDIAAQKLQVFPAGVHGPPVCTRKSTTPTNLIN